MSPPWVPDSARQVSRKKLPRQRLACNVRFPPAQILGTPTPLFPFSCDRIVHSLQRRASAGTMNTLSLSQPPWSSARMPLLATIADQIEQIEGPIFQDRKSTRLNSSH